MILLICAIYLLFTAIRLIFKQYKRDINDPPLVAGIPFLGVLLEYSKDPYQYLSKLHQEYGDVFTIHLFGSRMTFLTDPLVIKEYYANSALYCFDSVRLEFCESLFKLDRFSTAKSDKITHSLWRPNLQGASLDSMIKNFETFLNDKCKQVENSSVLLMEFCKHLFFDASLKTLLGGSVDPGEFEADFFVYDDSFPLLAAKLPRFLVRNSLKSLDRMCEKLSKLDYLNDPTCSDIIKERYILHKDFSEIEVARFQMTVIWAALGNTLPAAYWTLAHILQQKDVLCKVMKEIEIHGLHHSKLVYLDACVSETIRLVGAALSTRILQQDTIIDGYSMKKGDHLFVSTRMHHFAQDLIDKDQFKPERFLNKAKFSFLAFGGGKFLCPGRMLARAEIITFVATLLLKFDIQLLEPIPVFDHRRFGIGMYLPIQDSRCRIRRKVS